MRIETPGQVTDRITLLGRRDSCVYLVDGNGEYALLGGGMASIIPDIRDQVNRLGIDVEKIRRIIILHSHIDHVGAVPYLKQQWPWVVVSASKRAQHQLAQPQVISTIVEFSRLLLQATEPAASLSAYGLDITSIEVEEALGDTEKIPCGDLTLEVLEVPGHSSCSIAIYIPQEKALFGSDAGGILYGDTIFTSANSNFDQYQASLEKMSSCEVNVYLAEHYGALTGEDASTYLEKARDSAAQTRKLIAETLRKTGEVRSAAEEITELFMAEGSGYFLPREIMQMVIAQMTGFVAKNLSPPLKPSSNT
ncbi:MAG TPA: MBL fold metallo-hydrolase [Deltaproteobacteria bacterium]|nr:MBL fold metallo-hydrolase [Deltaproteobacteria bacterium]